jgi:hypothetical protein
LSVAEPLTDFYRRTHEANTSWTAPGARLACTRQTT